MAFQSCGRMYVDVSPMYKYNYDLTYDQNNAIAKATRKERERRARERKKLDEESMERSKERWKKQKPPAK